MVDNKLLKIGELDYSPSARFKASQLLFRAFSEDPLFLSLFLGHNREKDILRFFEYMLMKSTLLREKTLSLTTNDALYGIATFEQPESVHGLQLLTSPRFLLESVRLAAALPSKTFNLLNTYMSLTSSVRPKAPHHYLVYIGILPHYQGQGFGKAMLEAIHQQVDSHPTSIGIGLDTENPSNVKLYERFGYKQVSEKKLGDLTIYCMFRHKNAQSQKGPI